MTDTGLCAMQLMVQTREGEGGEPAGQILVPHGPERFDPRPRGGVRYRRRPARARTPASASTVFDSGEATSYNLTR